MRVTGPSRGEGEWQGWAVTGSMPGSSDQMVAQGAEIAFEGGPVADAVFVVDGWIILAKSLGDGKSLTVDLLLPGDAVHLRMASGDRSLFDVRSLTPARFLLVPEADESPHHDAVAAGLRVGDAAARARRAERMVRLGWAPADTRIAYLLIELGLRAEAAGLRGGLRRLHLPLTQAQLGEMAGLSAVHVCRTMHALSDAGLIGGTCLSRLDIPRLTRLARLADVDIDELRARILPRVEPKG